MRRRRLLAATATIAGAGCVSTRQTSDGYLDETGTIDVRVDGDPIDLTDDRFQAEHADNDSRDFHFHETSEDWYMEGTQRVTVAEGIDLLPHFGYERDGWRVLTVDGAVYDESEAGTETAFFVNGTLVDPEAYELQADDHIDVAVTTDGAASYETEGLLDARGDIEILVDGEEVDLTADRYQAEHADDVALAFHFHEHSENWYMEGTERVAFGEGLDLLPEFSYVRSEGYHRLAIDDTVYDERDAGSELAFFIDGELVDPTAIELYDGDRLVVEITTP